MKDTFPSLWLGSTRGYLSDWVTQKWVKLTGQKVDLSVNKWLDGPIGQTRGIGSNYFHELAEKENLEVRVDQSGVGLIEDFKALESDVFQSSDVEISVQNFYQRTSDYNLDVWAEWVGIFKPFGTLLAFIFSRRLQQLNLPLSSLETSQGMTSEVIQLVERNSSDIRYTAWLRHLRSTGRVLYAGCYSVCRVPGFGGVCVKVVFPLPNGNAVVIMRPELENDGSLKIISSGSNFGDPGFYFVVKNPSGHAHAKYIKAMRESIHVYPAENLSVRADHVLKLFGMTFLRLHYRMNTG